MKKILITLTVLSVMFVSSITFLAIWQEENIKSILMGVMENADEIDYQRNENQINMVNDVNTYMDIPVREMTEEEKEKIEKGETTVTDVYQKIFEEKSEEQKTEENVPDKDAVVSRYMAELYKLQNEYTAKAEATIKQGADYYESIKDHSHDAEARAKTISRFTSVVRGIERECDAKVNDIIKKMEKELKSIGADTSIVSTMRSTYENEKQFKLSYYANKYLK